jgi:hypothetical protein
MTGVRYFALSGTPCRMPACRLKLRGEEKNMSTAKEEVESLLHKLPDSCSIEDIQYHLYVIEKVRHGLEDADRHGAITQGDAEGRLGW